MVVPEPAAVCDAPALLGLREEAARWLRGRGIAQWSPGEVSLDAVLEQVEAGLWFVLRQDTAVVGGLRLLWADEPIWGARPADAGYVHGLVVARRRAGESLGAALLTWAGHRARAGRRGYLRLDCVETNRTLRDYYARAGFREVARRDLDPPWRPTVLLEKHLR